MRYIYLSQYFFAFSLYSLLKHSKFFQDAQEIKIKNFQDIQNYINSN